MSGWGAGALLALTLAAAACGKAESRAKSVRPTAGSGEGGECLACGGESGSAASAGSEAGGYGGSLEPVAGTGPGGSESGGSGTGEGGEAGAPTVSTPELTLVRISLSQTLEVPLMQDGEVVAIAKRPVPLLAEKRALMRAFVAVTPEFVARDLVAVVDLKSPAGDDTLIATQRIEKSSLQDDLGTTFTFNVLARDLGLETTYRLRVLEADTTLLARFPEDGYQKLSLRQREAFKLVMVPMVANGVTPTFGAGERAALSARLFALFPATEVVIDVELPVPLPYPLDGDGAGWDDALDDIYDIRRDAEPDHDVFYYGMLAPSSSYDAYCGNLASCLVGYSNLADANDIGSRGSIGVTVFPDGSGAKDAWDTLAHELGHALGRDHSPCGVDPDDTDQDFPYPAGNLGAVYGYDHDLAKLLKPKQLRDLMGYCTPYWISDYTYQGIFDRLELIAGESFQALAWAPPELFRVARVDLHGQSTWRPDRQERRGAGQYRPVDLLDQAGKRVTSVQARIVRRDHSQGGQVWLPAHDLSSTRAIFVDLRFLGGGLLPL